jgi:hypothetical protein
MILGALKNYNLISWIGLGVASYGLVYLLIHEIYIHRRFRFTKNQKFISWSYKKSPFRAPQNYSKITRG